MKNVQAVAKSSCSDVPFGGYGQGEVETHQQPRRVRIGWAKHCSVLYRALQIERGFTGRLSKRRLRKKLGCNSVHGIPPTPAMTGVRPGS
ncbi:hypothetical protein GOP47_0010623 [Adiantum capillus-veneris]|uniref:Uncharacterized protein n=1 Tax=Adiantum capillus-veneris TaxID=13818 RepID=A0A9D4ZHY8_ADICA|nr:hypothetical protein GOP47_0010623 [Adiantum capillus-veneris]